MKRLTYGTFQMIVAVFFVPIAYPDDGPRSIPKAWDDAALAGWHVPLAASGVEPVPISTHFSLHETQAGRPNSAGAALRSSNAKAARTVTPHRYI